MRWLVPGLVVIAALLVPSEAWAWGPFTHLLFSQTIVQGASVLPPSIAQLLSAFASDYAYGAVAADIVVGKNLATYVKHAHNWQNVFQLLRGAETPAQRAFGFGYLSHLAADTVAHNYFIPFKLVESFPATFLKHTYWEARFDKRSYPLVAEMASDLMTQRFGHNDRLHEQSIAGTLFNFKVNKRIFDSVFLFQNLTRWQRTMTNIEQRSPFALTDEERQELIDMSIAAIRAFLWKLEESPVTRIDPRGDAAIREAKHVRRELKRLHRRGAVRADQVPLIGEYFRPAFRGAAEHPHIEMPGIVPLLHRLRAGDREMSARGEIVPSGKQPVLRRVVAAVKNGTRNGRARRAPDVADESTPKGRGLGRLKEAFRRRRNAADEEVPEGGS